MFLGMLHYIDLDISRFLCDLIDSPPKIQCLPGAEIKPQSQVSKDNKRGPKSQKRFPTCTQILVNEIKKIYI
jgi:hypothetical protein